VAKKPTEVVKRLEEVAASANEGTDAVV